jgi:hypothetical protein
MLLRENDCLAQSVAGHLFLNGQAQGQLTAHPGRVCVGHQQDQAYHHHCQVKGGIDIP